MRRLWTPKWVLVHLAAVTAVVVFLLLGRWQIGRAASGNLLSFGYAIEWPAFAAFVVFVWIREMRRAVKTDGAPAQPEQAPLRRQQQRPEAAYDETDDAELAAYNRYLAWLNANPHASPSEYPG